MIKAIIYKEWLKTRLVFFITLAVAIVYALYVIMSLSRIETLRGVDHIWLLMLMRDQTFIDVFEYLPLMIGIAIAVAQMMPEMAQQRLKLTLHLPYSYSKTIVVMLLTGIVELLIIFVLQLGIVVIYDLSIIVPELVTRVIMTSLPWYLCGLHMYLFASAICLEGTWKHRIYLSLIAVGCLVIYFMQPTPEAYNRFLPIIVVFIIFSVLLPLRSIFRFKEGCQD